MNFDEVVINRHSARIFTNEKVTEEQLNKILYSGSLAPSAKNRQPWKFYILSNEQKEYIMNMLYDWDKNHPSERTSVKGTANQIRESDKMIMIYSVNYLSKNKTKYYKKPDYISLRMCNRKYEFEGC